MSKKRPKGILKLDPRKELPLHGESVVAYEGSAPFGVAIAVRVHVAGVAFRGEASVVDSPCPLSLLFATTVAY